MPELPDLQVFSRNLTKKYRGKVLEQVNVESKKLNVPLKELKEALEGQELTGVSRVGKELHFEFINGQVLGLHLMLHGQLKEFDKKNEYDFTIIDLLFDDASGLALTDFQKAAAPTLNPEDTGVPDALDIDLEYLCKKLAATRTPIKTVLLNQHILRGIGNAYADEILWDAKLSPFSPSNKIPEAKVKGLLKSIKSVLEHAEKEIIKARPDIISGEVRDFLVVHQPRKKETTSGATIHQKEVGSRKTYYTDEQELFS